MPGLVVKFQVWMIASPLFIPVTGLKFSIWIDDKIHPANRAIPATGLIWRDPKKDKLKYFVAKNSDIPVIYKLKLCYAVPESH